MNGESVAAVDPAVAHVLGLLGVLLGDFDQSDFQG